MTITDITAVVRTLLAKNILHRRETGDFIVMDMNQDDFLWVSSNMTHQKSKFQGLKLWWKQMTTSGMVVSVYVEDLKLFAISVTKNVLLL